MMPSAKSSTPAAIDYSVHNRRVEGIKPMEIFVAPTLLELQCMTTVPCIGAKRSDPLEIEEIIEVNISVPQMLRYWAY